MTDSIFNPQNEAPQETITFSGAYEQLVGVGKKFRDNEALAKSALEKDAFIESLKRENKEMRQEVSTRLSLEEFLAKTKETKAPANNEEPQAPREQGVERNNAPSLDSRQVQDLVRAAMRQEQTATTRQANLNLSREELKKTLGDNFGEHLSKRVNELGLDASFVDEIASRSPKALIALLKIETPLQGSGNTPPNSNRNAGASLTTPASGGVRNEAYYTELRKSNIKEYIKPEMQIQRHKDAYEMGAKFFES